MHGCRHLVYAQPFSIPGPLASTGLGERPSFAKLSDSHIVLLFQIRLSSPIHLIARLAEQPRTYKFSPRRLLEATHCDRAGHWPSAMELVTGSSHSPLKAS